jgi:hypothetical protein
VLAFAARLRLFDTAAGEVSLAGAVGVGSLLVRLRFGFSWVAAGVPDESITGINGSLPSGMCYGDRSGEGRGGRRDRGGSRIDVQKGGIDVPKMVKRRGRLR